MPIVGFWRRHWPFPSGTSTDPSPTYTFPDTGTYTITLTAAADYTCPVTTTGEIDIHYLLDPQFESPEPQCFDGQSLLSAESLQWM